MSLRRRYKAKRDRLSKAAFLAQLDESRRYEGSYNKNSSFDMTPFAVESGYRGGGYYGTLVNQRSVSRSIRRGNYKTTTPYRIVISQCSGSTTVGLSVTQVNPWGGYTQKRLASCSDANANWWGGYDVSVPIRNNLVKNSQNALLSKIRNLAPTWDILTSVAELKETLGTIKGAATWLSTLIKHVSVRDIPKIIRHLRLKSTPKNRRKILSYYDAGSGYGVYYRADGGLHMQIIDVISNLWMSYRYSFMTTIYDLQDAMIALAAPSRAQDYELKTQVTLKDHFFSDVDLGWGTVFWQSDTSVQYRRRLSIDGSIRKRVWFSFHEDILNRLNPNTIISLLETSWELVPFSWVVDWFLRVSDYFRLLELDSLIAKSDVCVSERGTVDLSYYLSGCRANYPPYNPAYSGTASVVSAPGGGVSTGSSFYFDRSIGNVVVPGWSPSESWYTWRRGIDSSCLLWQSIKNRLSEPLDPRKFK